MLSLFKEGVFMKTWECTCKDLRVYMQSKAMYIGWLSLKVRHFTFHVDQSLLELQQAVDFHVQHEKQISI